MWRTKILNSVPSDTAANTIWRRFRRNVSISVVGTSFAAGLKLAQAIVLTRFLTVDDYGRILIVTNLFIFLDSFIGLRVSDVIFRFFQPLKEANNDKGVRKLIVICAATCLASGLIIYFGIFGLSSWLASTVYRDPNLSILFRVFGIFVLVWSFNGVYEPILRLHDQFSRVVMPQALGGLITLAILGFYFIGRNGKYDLKVVVSALLIGALVQSVPPLLDTFRLLKPFLTRTRLRGTSIDFRSEMLPCFLNSNLSGYLKFAISPGDIFLLGLVSTPSQVALYGLAKQLTAPFAMVQTTMQTAITPEIVFLRAKHRLKQLEQLITRYVLTASFIGGISLVLALVIGTILFSSIFAEQYSNALTIFYVLVVAAWLLLVMAVFRPVAITMDQLKWHNAALATSLLLLVALLATRRLNALTLAFVQLVEAAMLRPAFGVVVWKKLRHQLREI